MKACLSIGLAEFFEIRNEFYKDAQGGLLVYDVGMRESFEALDMWLAEAAKFGANYRDFPIALCANKADKKRTVSEEEGRKYAAARGLNYYETSAQTGQNVSTMFEFLFKAAVNRLNSSA